MSREIKFRGWDNNMHEWTSAFDMDNDGVVCPTTSPYSDNPDIRIMQFTGLLDKNGKEIYEGDILFVDWNDKRYKPHTIGPVSWDKQNACWQLGEGGSPEDDAKYNMEVIGNIYENPELLEQSK